MGYEKKKRKKSMNAAIAPMTEDDWQAEEDLRAVARAAEVEKDPERMKKVRALAKKRLEESKRRQAEAQNMIDLAEGKTP